MKQKSNSKRLVVALSLALALMLAIGGIVGLEITPVAYADTTGLEVTYLTGFRSSNSSTTHIYWRIDGANLGYNANFVVASPKVQYTSGGTTTEKTINMQYATAGTQGVTANLGGTSDRRKGDVATNHPTLYINITNPVNGDTYTIPSGTILKGPDGENKYYLDQDYKFTYNGSNWLLTDCKIPVVLSGYRSGNGTVLYVYGAKNLLNYYVADIPLIANASVDYIPASGEPSTITTSIKPESVAAGSISNKPALLFNLSKSVAVGDQIVIKKGTSFDNFAFDRDYKFTYVADSKWVMEGVANVDDETITLTKRGGNANTLQVWTPNVLPFENNEEFAKNTVVYVNGVATYTNYFLGLPISGTNHSFAIRLPSDATAGTIVKLPKDMVIHNYKLKDTTLFKWDGSAWSLVACDGTNHIFNDQFTCHDRTCACGHVEKATTEHTFTDGSFACVDRVCTTCGDTVTGIGHKFADGSFACQDRACTVCSQTIQATEQHVITGTGCTAKCDNCGEGATVHAFPEMPDGGWTVDNATVTVTTQPDCTTEGEGTIQCTKCDSTEVVVVNALGHSVAEGEKFCSRNCGYRIAYTADDMDEILALEDLTKYTYSDAHVVDSQSTFGQINRTPDKDNEGNDTNIISNDFIINAKKIGDKQYEYVDGKESTHNMLVSFSLNLSAYAQNYRSHYVWLNGHENGSFGIGFMFCFYENAQNLRVQYKSTDGKDINIVAAKALNGFALNTVQKFQLGVVQNSDGSFFVFAYWNGELFLTGTLTNAQLTSNANPDTHNGLGGAVAFRFNGSTAAPSVIGTICDLEHKITGTQYACKDYTCEICGVAIAHTAEHSWGEGVKTGNGSCTEKEVFTRTCSVCQSATTYEGNYVHVWDTENPHIVTPAQCNGVDKVVKYDCTLCDTQSENQTIANTGIAGAHTHVYADVVPATCVAGGTEQGICSKCGHKTEITETPINEDAHAYGNEIAKVAETCATAGTLAHYECSLCEKLFVLENGNYVEKTASELIIPAGHKYQAVAEVSATCTQNGTMAHYTCSGCDKLFVKDGENYVEKTAEQLVILAGHNYVEGICSVCQAKDNVYFFNQAMANVTSATTAEAKFNALKVAIEKYNLLSSEEKASNKATIDAQITAYNSLATQANQAHGKQTDTVASILGWVASVSALAAVALVLKKIIR